jgi:hypothetical protein
LNLKQNYKNAIKFRKGDIDRGKQSK